MLKGIWDCIGFAYLVLWLGQKTNAILSTSQMQNQNQWRLDRPRFLAL